MTITTVAYAPQELLPLMMLVEVMMLVPVDLALKDNVPQHAQLLKHGPIVHALIVPLTKKQTIMLVYAMEVTMQMLTHVLATIKNSPLQLFLSNKIAN